MSKQIFGTSLITRQWRKKANDDLFRFSKVKEIFSLEKIFTIEQNMRQFGPKKRSSHNVI